MAKKNEVANPYYLLRLSDGKKLGDCPSKQIAVKEAKRYERMGVPVLVAERTTIGVFTVYRSKEGE